MVNDKNFIVRASAKKTHCHYIDYLGQYKINDLSKLTGISESDLDKIFTGNKGVFDNELQIFYFNAVKDAEAAIKKILTNITSEKHERALYLTEPEIEYIRQALINEGSNTLHIRNKIKDDIFKKLNS
jgi:hypothetical protein